MKKRALPPTIENPPTYPPLPPGTYIPTDPSANVPRICKTRRMRDRKSASPLMELPGMGLYFTLKVEIVPPVGTKVYTFRCYTNDDIRVAVFGRLSKTTCEYVPSLPCATFCRGANKTSTQYCVWPKKPSLPPSPKDYPLGFVMRCLGPRKTHGRAVPKTGIYRCEAQETVQ